MKMQPKDKRKSKKVERKKKKIQNTKKASEKIAMMRKKDMEIQERLDVKDVKSGKQDVAGDGKERKKRKGMERKNAAQKRRAEQKDKRKRISERRRCSRQEQGKQK